MTDTLTPAVALPPIVHISAARTLLGEFEAISETSAPARLRNLVDAYEPLSKPEPATDPLDAILDAAAAGTLDVDKLAGLVAQAAEAKGANDYRQQLVRAASRTVLHRFSRELLDGGADELIDSVRPAFDAAVATVDDGIRAVGTMSQSYAEFVENAEPEQLLAWQALRLAVATVGAVVGLVVRTVGVRSLLFPMINSPVGNFIDPESFAAIDDAAIFTSAPGALAATAASYRDYADIAASQGNIKPRDPGMRFPKWLGTRTLNSVRQARDVLRAWAETKVEDAMTPGLVGRLPNPYA